MRVEGPVEVRLAELKVGEEGDAAVGTQQPSYGPAGEGGTTHPHSSLGSSFTVIGENRLSLNALQSQPSLVPNALRTLQLLA